MQADKFRVQEFGDNFRDFGFAGAGGAFDQQRFFERQRKKHRRLDPFVGDVMRAAQALGDKFLRHVHFG